MIWFQGWNAATNEYTPSPTGDVFLIGQTLVAKYASAPATPGYTHHIGTDAPCTNCDLIKAWTTDLAQLMWLCDADPGCIGFVTTGYLKNSTSTMTPNPICDLYVKDA